MKYIIGFAAAHILTLWGITKVENHPITAGFLSAWGVVFMVILIVLIVIRLVVFCNEEYIKTDSNEAYLIRYWLNKASCEVAPTASDRKQIEGLSEKFIELCDYDFKTHIEVDDE